MSRLCTRVEHAVCHVLLLTVAGPILIGFGTFIIVRSSRDPRSVRICQLNDYSKTWTDESVYGYAVFSKQQAYARMSIMQGDSAAVCPSAALALSCDIDLQGSAGYADPVAATAGDVQAWQQWKQRTIFPPTENVITALAYTEGCSLRVRFFNGAANASGTAEVVSVESPFKSTTTLTIQDLQCGSNTQCSSSSPTSSSVSAGGALSSDIVISASVAHRYHATPAAASSSCSQQSCPNACAAHGGSWSNVGSTCTVSTGLLRLCARASPTDAARPQIYIGNTTAPPPATRQGCFVTGDEFQPNQEASLGGSSNGSQWNVENPYLEYLMLTGSGGFGIPAVYSRISGIIMLVIGCVITVCIAAACCCCCALVRRANKYNNGQPQGYMQNLLHAASQRYNIPVGYNNSGMQNPGYSPQYPAQQQMVQQNYGASQYNLAQGPGYSSQPGPSAPQYTYSAYSNGEGQLVHAQGQHVDAQAYHYPSNKYRRDPVFSMPATAYPGPAVSSPYSDRTQ